MPKLTLAWNPDEYTTVRERVEAFRASYPLGRIVTELHSRTRTRVTFRALVYRSADEAEPAATGWASEREGDGEVNQAACLENAETSAIGRALANLGFSASKPRATGARPHPDERSPAQDRVRVEPLDMGEADVTVTDRPAPYAPRPAATRTSASMHREANALLDVLLLLDAAERAGLPAERVRMLRRALTGRSVAPSLRQRTERELRDWLIAHRGSRAHGELDDSM